jgi:hypothetical protein
MSQDEMEHLITAAGYRPRQRTNLYERFVTREDTAALARQYRHAITPANRDLVSPGPEGTGAAAPATSATSAGSALLPVLAS